ncbi:branched-chain amino acid ABC transporter ATP-binding protein/permease [Hydrogenophaga sp.]|uniref:branched-chain amino acid ABC transporter ATP-binding protein/permease n=1 Tax=Hydrogenophaga sp. TaxID=1904254 RepID=UPI00356811E8
MNKTVAAILAAGGVLASVPWLGLPAFVESLLYLVCHWTILALSWNILSGYTGYFSFGHGAFFGAGMYTTAVLAGKLDWPFLATLPLAAAVPAVLGLTIGFVVFRVHSVRGELFALLTLAVTFVLGTVILNTPIDGGPGVYLNAVEIPHLGPTQSAALYLMALAAAVLALLVSWRVRYSKLGTGLFAIHDDEDVAEVMGVPTFRYKMVAIAISSALAGVAGGIHALFVSYVTVGETFNLVLPLTVVLMSVLGGTRHWAGPAVGAVFITGLLYFFTAGANPLVGKAAIGVILIAVILFMPKGVMGYVQRKSKTAPTPQPADDEASALASAPVQAPDSHEPLLVVNGLSKAFKGVLALDGVSLDVRRGEILGLLGPNGSGKSTFINVVSGHFPSSGGQMRFDGRELTGLPAHQIAQSGIARTYQIPRPFPHLTVLQNVSLAAEFGVGQRDERAAEAEAWRCLAFTGLADKANALPDELNLHQRKFLELTRALASRPRLVLLDEVLSGLTPSEIEEAIELVRCIRDRGATIVFVEHVMRAVMALADRVAVLNHGRLLAIGPAQEVMRNPEVVKAYLGAGHA